LGGLGNSFASSTALSRLRGRLRARRRLEPVVDRCRSPRQALGRRLLSRSPAPGDLALQGPPCRDGHVFFEREGREVGRRRDLLSAPWGVPDLDTSVRSPAPSARRFGGGRGVAGCPRPPFRPCTNGRLLSAASLCRSLFFGCRRDQSRLLGRRHSLPAPATLSRSGRRGGLSGALRVGRLRRGRAASRFRRSAWFRAASGGRLFRRGRLPLLVRLRVRLFCLLSRHGSTIRCDSESPALPCGLEYVWAGQNLPKCGSAETCREAARSELCGFRCEPSGFVTLEAAPQRASAGPRAV
jgi:hypothetical protein